MNDPNADALPPDSRAILHGGDTNAVAVATVGRLAELGVALDVCDGEIMGRHDLLACLDVECPACSMLLCPDDRSSHLDLDCPCPTAPTFALRAARRQAAEARAAHPSSPAPEPTATTAAPGAAPPLVAAANLALHQVRPFLLGLQGGALLAGREISGLAAVLSIVEMAISALDGTPTSGPPCGHPVCRGQIECQHPNIGGGGA